MLQAIYSLRCERPLLETLGDNMLSRWFVGLGADDPVWGQSSFGKNRDDRRDTAAGLAWAFHGSLQPVDGQQDAGQDDGAAPLSAVFSKQRHGHDALGKQGRRRIALNVSRGSSPLAQPYEGEPPSTCARCTGDRHPMGQAWGIHTTFLAGKHL